MDLEKIVVENSIFALNMYKKITEKRGNVFFSPFSISNSLAMIYAGVSGKTEEEMANILHFPSEKKYVHQSFQDLRNHFKKLRKKKNIQFYIDDALWVQKGYKIKSEFINICKKYHESELFNIDFIKDPEGCRVRINKWVEKQTRAKIKDIIPQSMLNDLTRMILSNAIYFKGIWRNQFDLRDTRDENFWQTPEKKSKVKMMTQESYFGYKENDALQVLEMPYLGSALSIIILLPKKIEGIYELEDKLTSETLEEWVADLNTRKIKVSIPRFRTTERHNLRDALTSIGIQEAFAHTGDFSGVNDSEKLYLSEIIHQSYINVDETGTEAAVATISHMVLGIDPFPIPEFRADHPFLYLIRDNQTGIVIFMGRLLNPTSSI